MNTAEMTRLAHIAAATVEADVADGTETRPAWRVAIDDAWDAVAAWSRPASPEMLALTADTAAVLMRAADLLWARHLIAWGERHVVPRLADQEADLLQVSLETALQAATEDGGWFVEEALATFAELAGLTLPTRY
jgi:hypothetical protein